MLFETTIISIAVGWLRKGKLSNFELVPFEGWPFILCGFIIYILQIGSIIFFPKQISSWVSSNTVIFQAASSLFLILGIVASSRSAGFLTIASGFGMNGAAMIFNGGRMPVSPEALIDLGLINKLQSLSQGGSPTHMLADNITKLYFLSDIIPMPIITPKVISIGDIFLAIGIFLIIQKYMIFSEPLQS